MAMTPDELIDTSMMLIVHSGDARAAAFHALQEAKAGNYEEAKKLMAESQKKALEAHHIQTGLLTDEGNGEGPPGQSAAGSRTGPPDDQYAGTGADCRAH